MLAIHIRALRPTTSNYRSNWFIMTFGNIGFASPSNDDELLLDNELRVKTLSLRLEKTSSAGWTERRWPYAVLCEKITEKSLWASTLLSHVAKNRHTRQCKAQVEERRSE